MTICLRRNLEKGALSVFIPVCEMWFGKQFVCSMLSLLKWYLQKKLSPMKLQYLTEMCFALTAVKKQQRHIIIRVLKTLFLVFANTKMEVKYLSCVLISVIVDHRLAEKSLNSDNFACIYIFAHLFKNSFKAPIAPLLRNGGSVTLQYVVGDNRIKPKAGSHLQALGISWRIMPNKVASKQYLCSHTKSKSSRTYPV